jgi:hypothetical protein
MSEVKTDTKAAAKTPAKKAATAERTVRPLSIVYTDAVEVGGKINVIIATRKGNKLADALVSNRDARFIRVNVDE